MFERRLKVFLGVLILFTAVLVLRAAQVQVLEHEAWSKNAVDTMKRTERWETLRGEIRDLRGRRVAMDQACVDAAVDYRVLTREPDKDWVKEFARGRLTDRLGEAWKQAARDHREQLLADEVAKVREDIDQMWPRLAKISRRPLEEIEETRRQIVEKVKMRRRFVWYYSYEQALQERKKGKGASSQPSSVWKLWLLDDDEDVPDVDNFRINVTEETSRHVVLKDIDGEAQAELKTYLNRFPGLEVRYGTRRVYPYGDAAPHVIGRLSKVLKEDMKNDPNARDELRQYEPNDRIGRGGIEALCEQVLRGSRGREEKVEGTLVRREEAVPGRDVKMSIDVELQAEIQALFKRVPVTSKDADGKDVVDVLPMHGAAVVIDVPTGEVRALVSAPSFDLNLYDEQYAQLSSAENLDEPLFNRATQAEREPGSTVKPMVGIAGVASNVRRPDDEFECIGYMVVDGRVYSQWGRCWVNSMFHNVLCPDGRNCMKRPCPLVAHHVVPSRAPHPTGRLKLPDAIERSCNPYFESIAHAMGPVELSAWFDRFGLGRKTYVGIPEAKGMLPVTSGAVGRANSMVSTWTAGIGQGPVQATPLQVANVAATLARRGVWVRPRLLVAESAEATGPTTRHAGPDRVDLGLPEAALAAVKEGMIGVVNGAAGSGDKARRADVVIAGKTGSATAAEATMPEIDPVTKRPVLNEKNKVKRVKLVPSTRSQPNSLAPWYRDTGREGSEKPTLTHSWFMGYTPADDPQIAFAVLVEYGGGGGSAAASVANEMIEACIKHRVLNIPEGKKAAANPPATNVAAVQPGTELLHPVAR